MKKLYLIFCFTYCSSSLFGQLKLELNTNTAVVNGIEQGSVFNKPLWSFGNDLYYSAGASESERDIYYFTPGAAAQPLIFRQKLNDTCSNIAFGPIALHDALYFFNVFYRNEKYGIVKYELGSDSLSTFLPLGDSLEYCPDLEAPFQNEIYISLQHKPTNRHRLYKLDNQGITSDITQQFDMQEPRTMVGTKDYLYIADNQTLVHFDGIEVVKNTHFEIEQGYIHRGDHWLFTSEKSGSNNTISVFNPSNQTLIDLHTPLPIGQAKPQYALHHGKLYVSGLDPKALIRFDTSSWQSEIVCGHAVPLVGGTRSFSVFQGKIVIADRISSDFGFECALCDEQTGTLSLLADINPDAGSSFPKDYVQINHKLYFFANDGMHGNEIWSMANVVNTTSTQSENQLKVWPNPTTGFLHFTSLQAEITQVTIFNSFGQNITSFSKLKGSDVETINLHHLDAGVYRLKFSSKESAMTQLVQVIKI